MGLSFVYNLFSNTSPCSWATKFHINVLDVPLRRGYMYFRSPNCTQFTSVEVIWDQFPLSLYQFHLSSLLLQANEKIKLEQPTVWVQF